MYKIRANNGIGNIVFTTNSLAEAENYVSRNGGFIQMPNDSLLNEHLDMQEKWYN